MSAPLANAGQTIGFALELFGQYPRRTAIVFGSYVVAGLAEGIGIAALLPILFHAGSGARVPGVHEPTALVRIATGVLDAFGVQPTLGALLVLLVAGISVKALLVYFAGTQAAYANADVSTTLRLRLIKSLVRARWRLFGRQPVGALATGIGLEADNTANAYSAACNTVSFAIQAAIYTGAALLVSWQVTLLAVGVGLLLVAVFAPFVGMVRAAGTRWAVAIAQLTQKLVDGFMGFKALKAMGRELQLYARLAHEVQAIRSAIRRWTRVLQLRTAIEEPALTAFVAVGIYLYLAYNPISFEALVLMVGLFYRSVSRLTLLQKHYGGVAQLESFYRQLMAKIEAAERDVEVMSGRPAPALDAPIRLERVGFAYGDRVVLAGADAAIAPRALTVIFGPSGAGKSTIADLLLGLIAPDSGRVTISGVPLAEIDLSTWRARIGFVPQEVLLFNDTLLFNVTLGDPDLSRADAEAALREAGAWEFVAALPSGIDSPVGERGAMLSGGQRQRIALARALVRRPDLLILDEATSALDPATEAAIWASLRDISRDHTILAITHQPTVLHLADEIYRLADGRLERLPRETARGGRLAAAT